MLDNKAVGKIMIEDESSVLISCYETASFIYKLNWAIYPYTVL